MLAICIYICFYWGINSSFQVNNRAKCTSRKIVRNASAFFERKTFERKTSCLHRLHIRYWFKSNLRYLINQRYRNKKFESGKLLKLIEEQPVAISKVTASIANIT